MPGDGGHPAVALSIPGMGLEAKEEQQEGSVHKRIVMRFLGIAILIVCGWVIAYDQRTLMER